MTNDIVGSIIKDIHILFAMTGEVLHECIYLNWFLVKTITVKNAQAEQIIFQDITIIEFDFFKC